MCSSDCDFDVFWDLGYPMQAVSMNLKAKEAFATVQRPGFWDMTHLSLRVSRTISLTKFSGLGGSLWCVVVDHIFTHLAPQQLLASVSV